VRRATTLQAEAQLAMAQVVLEQGSVSPPKREKSKRLEGMRSALGLDRLANKSGKKGGTPGRDLGGGTGETPLYTRTPSSRTPGDGWFVEGASAPLPLDLDLPDFGEDPVVKEKGAFGRMFSKK
jgi:hypothetical protein